MYGDCGATVAAWAWLNLRRYLSKEELFCYWLVVVKRFFSTVRAEDSGWQCKIDRRRQGTIICFLWVFFGGAQCFGNLL